MAIDESTTAKHKCQSLSATMAASQLLSLSVWNLTPLWSHSLPS